METVDATQLKIVLEKHGKYLRNEVGGERADLSRANLSRAYLSGAYLSGANLSRAYLSGANLSGANLSGANLSGANLSGANLSGAYLSGANLSGAYLSGADLSRAYLSGADLSRADLSGANLSGANLSGANLSGANLSGADLDLSKVPEAIQARWRILPDAGVVIGWKKCANNALVSLEISPDTARSNAPGSRKCRCQAASVIGIWIGNVAAQEAVSMHDGDFVYRVGETVSVSNFDKNPLKECAPGIHFYITRAEAEAHS